MATSSDALTFLLLVFGGWVNRSQQKVIDYLLEENRVLREQLGGRRIRLDDNQRRRLAIKGKAVGQKILGQIASIVTPDTILRWYRRLVAKKYDGSKKGRPGRPRTKTDIVELVVTMARDNPTWGYTRIRDAFGILSCVPPGVRKASYSSCGSLPNISSNASAAGSASIPSSEVTPKGTRLM